MGFFKKVRHSASSSAGVIQKTASTTKRKVDNTANIVLQHRDSVDVKRRKTANTLEKVSNIGLKSSEVVGKGAGVTRKIAQNPAVIAAVATYAPELLPGLIAVGLVAQGTEELADNVHKVSEHTGRASKVIAPPPRSTHARPPPGTVAHPQGDIRGHNATGEVPVSTVKGFLDRSYDSEQPVPGGYFIDPELSGKRVQVYNHPTKGAVVVHRGTDGAQDMLTDAKISGGASGGKRVDHSQKIQRQAEAKYGPENTMTMGHSLGGWLAEEVAHPHSRVLTLNKAAVPSELGKKIKPNQTDIRSEHDAVSAMSHSQHGGNRVTIPSASRHPLNEHKTDVLDRLGDQKV